MSLKKNWKKFLTLSRLAAPAYFPFYMRNFLKTPLGVSVLIIAVGLFVGGVLFYINIGGINLSGFFNTAKDQDRFAGWHTFSSPGMAVELKYPKDWGEIKSTLEPCLIGETFMPKYEDRPCLHIFITAPELPSNPLVIASQSRLFAKYGKQRDLYYGDLFSVARKKGFNIDKFIQEYCITEAPLKNAERCEGKTNPNGIIYVKVYQDLLTDNTEKTDKKALYYLISHKDHEFDGIIISSEFFSEDTPLSEIEADLDALVSSIKFL